MKKVTNRLRKLTRAVHKKWGWLRWIALAALFASAPIALGWVIVVSAIFAVNKQAEGKIQRCRARLGATITTLAMVGCCMSALWCSLVGWIIVSGVLVLALCYPPQKEQHDDTDQETSQKDWRDDAIDVEFWECSDEGQVNEDTDYEKCIEASRMARMLRQHVADTQRPLKD